MLGLWLTPYGMWVFEGRAVPHACACGSAWAAVTDLGYEIPVPRARIVRELWELVVVEAGASRTGLHFAEVRPPRAPWGERIRAEVAAAMLADTTPRLPWPLPARPHTLKGLDESAENVSRGVWVLKGRFRLLPETAVSVADVDGEVLAAATQDEPFKHVAVVVGATAAPEEARPTRCPDCWVGAIRENARGEQGRLVAALMDTARLRSPYAPGVRAGAAVRLFGHAIEVSGGEAWVRPPWATVCLSADTVVRIAHPDFPEMTLARESGGPGYLNLYHPPWGVRWDEECCRETGR
jgi:hypothetical protein